MIQVDRRRTLFRLAGAVAAAGAAPLAFAQAQGYPTRPVKVIVPYAPGGQGDVAMRIVTNQLSVFHAHPFVVENISGSSGIAAMTAFLRAPNDGYTLTYGDAGVLAINPAMSKQKLPYDTLQDLEPVGMFAQGALFLVVHDSVPAKTLPELVALLKSKPGAYSYASSGIGSPHHLTMEDFRARLGLDLVHVPFRGSSQSVPALVGGQVHMAIAALQSIAPFVKDGRLRVLGVNSKERSAFLPEAPPMASVGLPDFDHLGGIGLYARVGTPPEIVTMLSASIRRTVTMPENIAKLAATGLEPPPDSSPQYLAAAVRRDIERFTRIVQAAGISRD